MDAESIFARCAERRRAVADLLESVSDDQLTTPSLCAGWDVRTVAGHLTVPLVISPPRFAILVARHGGNFHRASEAAARAQAQQPPQRLAATLREHAESRFTPPLHGPAAPLTDLCVHSADMRAPLGLPVHIAPDEAAAAFDLITGFSMFFLPRGRLRGVRIAPDDADRTWGDGADLTGSSTDILLAVLGRRKFLDGTSGPGRDLLAARL